MNYELSSKKFLKERWNQHLLIQKLLLEIPSNATIHNFKKTFSSSSTQEDHREKKNDLLFLDETPNSLRKKNMHGNEEHRLQQRNTENYFYNILLEKELGKGVYGTVYQVFLKYFKNNHNNNNNNNNNNQSGYLLAFKNIQVKESKDKRQNIFSRILREEVAGAYLNCLVYLNICPNFTIIHRSFLSFNDESSFDFAQNNNYNKQQIQKLNEPKSTFFKKQCLTMTINAKKEQSNHRNEEIYNFLLTMELANGNAIEWMEQIGKMSAAGAASSSGKLSSSIINEDIILPFVTQILMGILCYTNYYDIVHNDLYLKNILYIHLPNPINLQYIIYDSTNIIHEITIIQCKTLFLISDFGICSSPSYLDLDHRKMSQMAPIQRKTNSLLEMNFTNHVLEYSNIAPRCRDIVSFIKSLLLIKCLSRNCIQWLQRILYLFEKTSIPLIKNVESYDNAQQEFLIKSANKTLSLEQLTKNILEILDESFLQKSSIQNYQSYFSHQINPFFIPCDKNDLSVHQFIIDLRTPSKEKTIKSLQLLTNDYLNLAAARS